MCGYVIQHGHIRQIRHFEWQDTIQYSVVESIICCVLSCKQKVDESQQSGCSQLELNNILSAHDSKYAFSGECKRNNHSFATHNTVNIRKIQHSDVTYHGFEGYMANIRPEHRDIGLMRSQYQGVRVLYSPYIPRSYGTYNILYS